MSYSLRHILLTVLMGAIIATALIGVTDLVSAVQVGKASCTLGATTHSPPFRIIRFGTTKCEGNFYNMSCTPEPLLQWQSLDEYLPDEYDCYVVNRLACTMGNT